MRENILFDRVKKLVEAYDHSKPFAFYLKDFFRANPQMGARDRRETRDYCYHLLRIGKNLPELPFNERLALAAFICSEKLFASLEVLLTNHSELTSHDVERPLIEKLELVKSKYPEFKLDLIFPNIELLSNEIDKEKFLLSFLIQPRVYIRIRKGFEVVVEAELNELKIAFTKESELIYSFAAAQSLEQLKNYTEGNFEIQDLNSAAIINYLHPNKDDKWWDVCAASGGKSLLLVEKESDLFILATDVRENILKNYSQRMKKVHFSGYAVQKIDLTQKSIDAAERFDGLIADVPCSGSGTWARSPENLMEDQRKNVRKFYQPLQRTIVEKAIPHLRETGTFIYSTCSVFAAENEENVRYFEEKLPLQLIEMKCLKGYENRADSLFVAVFKKVSKK